LKSVDRFVFNRYSTHFAAMLFKSRVYFFLLLPLLLSCLDNEALRGKIVVKLTDAPVDVSTIRKVNIAIRRVEVLPKGSQQWSTVQSFEEPKTVDLLDYTQGKVYDLTEQFMPPGDFEGIRLELNIANVSNGLIVFPQSNIQFTDGSLVTLIVDGPNNYVTALGEFSILTSQTTFLTLDFDMRKSIVLAGNEYKLRPSMRMVETGATGGIEGQFRDFSTYNKVIVFAYKSGTFNNSETEPAVSFAGAVSSARVRNSTSGLFYIPFLPEGSYELQFAFLNDNGELIEMLGRRPNVTVTRGDDVFISTAANELQ
jgi:hypothetical protein